MYLSKDPFIREIQIRLKITVKEAKAYIAAIPDQLPKPDKNLDRDFLYFIMS